ncbi:helix-turn-helix domain-containing protein [Nocardia nova]|nr:helix-turn-helix domain-containing protein [Nocardia nova]
MQKLVTTQAIEPPFGFDHWADELARTMSVSVDARSTGMDHFRGTAAVTSIGELRILSAGADPMQVRRTQRLTLRHEEDFYKVGLQVSGTATVEQDGRQCHLGPRDLVFCDTTRPYSFIYDTEFRTVLALVPRAAVPLGPNSLSGITARTIDSESGISPVLVSLLLSLSGRSGPTSSPVASRVSDGAVSLLTGLLTENIAGTQPAWSAPAMMLRVRDHIDRNLADPNLSPDTIAAALGISRRYLFKLFAAENMTVSGWVRSERLRRCARDLTDPSMREQSIGLIAARWGLVDSGHFARLFKSTYGRTPREYRNQAVSTEVEYLAD